MSTRKSMTMERNARLQSSRPWSQGPTAPQIWYKAEQQHGDYVLSMTGHD